MSIDAPPLAHEDYRPPARTARYGRWLVALGLILAVLGVVALMSTGDSGAPKLKPLWTGGFNAGTLAEFQHTPWNFIGAPPPDIVRQPVREGRGAVRFSVGPGGQRQELVAGARSGGPEHFAEGEERYFAFSTRFGDWPVLNTWQVIAQWKADGTGPPPVSMLAGAWGKPRIELAAAGWPGGGSDEHHDLGPLTRGVWTDWVVRIRFSEDPDDAEVQVWRDGDQALDVRGWRSSFEGEAAGTRGGTLRSGRRSYLKHGIYRDPSIQEQAVLWTDDWAIATPE